MIVRIVSTECSSGGGQVFGIPIDQCVSNERERARLQQQQSQSGNEDIQSDNGESTQVLRKSSHGSRTSFSSLIEGFKFDKVSIPHSSFGSLARLLFLPAKSHDFEKEQELRSSLTEAIFRKSAV